MTRTPIYRDDDHELLGFVAKDAAGWTGQTIFGYIFSRSTDRATVERTVRQEGLQILAGLWHYFDEDDRAWQPCILKEVYESRVTVIRTNAMGYQDPDDYKIVTITNPTETKLVKS